MFQCGEIICFGTPYRRIKAAFALAYCNDIPQADAMCLQSLQSLWIKKSDQVFIEYG